MNKFYLIVIVALAVLVGDFPQVGAAGAATPEFCKNGVYVTPAQLIRAQQRLLDPAWKESNQLFLSRVKSGIKLVPSPYTGSSSWQFLEQGRKDVMLAMDLALYSAISADENVRQNFAGAAKNILLAWASSTVFDGQFSDKKPQNAKDKRDYAGLGLYVGLVGIGATHTYHILKCNNALTVEEDKVISNWLSMIFKVVLKGQNRWKTNNYFGQPVGNNHISIQNAALYGIAVVTGDSKQMDWVLRDPSNVTNFKNMLDFAIYDGRERVKMLPDTIGVMPVRGEITDRYRMADSKKGLHYAFFHLLGLTLTAEVATNQGVDLYRLKSMNGESLVDPLRYYSEFLVDIVCDAKKTPIVNKISSDYKFYNGAKIEPYYWTWVEPLLNHLNDQKNISILANKIRLNACKPATPQYLPVPLSILTHGNLDNATVK